MSGRPALNRTRFVISLPDTLLRQLDSLAEIDGVKRPDVIEAAVTRYVALRVKQAERATGITPPRRRSK